MKNMFYLLPLLVLCGLLTGCGSFLPDHKTLPGPNAIEVYQARREPPPPIEPALSEMPRAPINPAQPATIAASPLPVWNDAQVVKVDLDAYVNEKGEAFGPSVKYVVKQAGGWNVDALRNPHRSYVPTENTPPIPSANGFTANPMIAPGSGPLHTVGEVRPLQPSVLQDLGQVRVTGFVERGQEGLARSMAQAGEVPVFDESLGWILVPSSALVPSNQIPQASSQALPQQATPIPQAMAPAQQGMQPMQPMAPAMRAPLPQQMMPPQPMQQQQQPAMQQQPPQGYYAPAPSMPTAPQPSYSTPATLPPQY